VLPLLLLLLLLLQGMYAPELAADVRLPVTTDAGGRFVVDRPALAKYTFASTGAGACRDAVMLSDLQFPVSIVLPPVESATVTAIALLTVPAARSAWANATLPQPLWEDVYAMFGYYNDSNVDYLTLSGMSTPQLTAVLGSSSVAMSTFSTLHGLIKGVISSADPTTVAEQVVQAVYDRLESAVTNTTDAAKVRTSAMLRQSDCFALQRQLVERGNFLGKSHICAA
jgi:hypothetical protein